MAQINTGYTRRTELRCTLAEMALYGAKVIPHDGEVVYVKKADGTYDIKMGDGKTTLINLPYVINYSAVKELKEAAEKAQSLAEEAYLHAFGVSESFEVGLSVVDGELCITFEEEDT